LQNTRLLVCRSCLDTPQEQLRAFVLPADPVPIVNARVQDFDAAASNYRATAARAVIDPVTGIPIPSTTLRTTQDGQNRAMNPFGLPEGLDANAVMPFARVTRYGVPLSLLSVTANGTATVTVTCSAVHGLTTDKQVAVEGLANIAANGFYSVTVLTGTAFSYETYGSIGAGALLTPTTRIITALVGLPRGYTRIPKIDGPSLNAALIGTNLIALEAGGLLALEAGTGFLHLQAGP
jgi:hypothetical protein